MITVTVEKAIDTIHFYLQQFEQHTEVHAEVVAHNLPSGKRESKEQIMMFIVYIVSSKNNFPRKFLKLFLSKLKLTLSNCISLLNPHQLAQVQQ